MKLTSTLAPTQPNATATAHPMPEHGYEGRLSDQDRPLSLCHGLTLVIRKGLASMVPHQSCGDEAQHRTSQDIGGDGIGRAISGKEPGRNQRRWSARDHG